jgi:hypothetical protein
VRVNKIVIGVLIATAAGAAQPALTGPAAERNGLRLTIAAEPARTLPGIPVRLVLRIANASGDPLPVPRWAALRVVPANGEPFIAATGGEEDGAVLLPVPDGSVIAPHAEERIVYSNFGFESAAWFLDPRLNTPGTYRVDALLSDEPITIETPIINIDVGSLPVRALSNTQIITIEEPSGVDASMWRTMLSQAKKEFGVEAWSSAYWTALGTPLAIEAWRDYPTSVYAAYLVDKFPAAPVDKIRLAVKALMMNPPNAPTLRFIIGAFYAQMSRNAQTENRRNLQEALDYAAQARTELTGLLISSEDPRVQEAVRNELQQLGSVDEILAKDGEVAAAQRNRAASN